MVRAGRRLAVRPSEGGHPVRRAAPAAARPRRARRRVPDRDHRADRGGGRAHARPVLLDAGGAPGRRRAEGPSDPPAALPGRGLHVPAGQAVRRGRTDLPVRHPVALAGRGRPRPVAATGHHGPHPVPAAGRPSVVGAVAGGRGARRQRVHGGRRDARRAAAGAGRGAAAPVDGRPRRRRRPRPAARHGPLRRLPEELAAAVLGDHRPGRRARRPPPLDAAAEKG